MKRNMIYVSLGIMGTIVLTTVLFIYEKHSDDAFIKTDSMGRPVLKICNAMIYDEPRDKNILHTFTHEKKCNNEFEYISQGYIKHNNGFYWLLEKTHYTSHSQGYVKYNNSVYWLVTKSYQTSPCKLVGSGDMTGLFHNLSWDCIKAKPMQTNIKEENTLDKVSELTPLFSSFDEDRKDLEHWQYIQLINYAKDESAVYYKGKKIGGADPKEFTPIFPFGNDREWKRYSAAKSGKNFYLDGKEIGLVNLEAFKPLKIVRCPEHGIYLCGSDYKLAELLTYGGWFLGIFGVVGEDIVFLQPNNVTIFNGMASKDMFSFVTSKKIYLYAKNKFYELEKSNSNDMKLIDMDVSFYNENP